MERKLNGLDQNWFFDILLTKTLLKSFWKLLCQKSYLMLNLYKQQLSIQLSISRTPCKWESNFWPKPPSNCKTNKLLWFARFGFTKYLSLKIEKKLMQIFHLVFDLEKEFSQKWNIGDDEKCIKRKWKL